jgi:acid phosphatase (class A)
MSLERRDTHRHSPRATALLPAALLALAVLAGCGTVGAPTSPADVPEIRAGSGYLVGYLPRKDLPDSLALLPPPPAAGSSAQAADEDAYRSTRALRDTPRWAIATGDADLTFPKAAETFSCALGIEISQEATPHLNMLLRRTLADAGLATYRAKDHYKRQRPFARFDAGTCTPRDEAMLRNDGSYPSGHAAAGWAWALVLTELAPERADALLQRGEAFGQSRVVCGVHWPSDVRAGQVVAAGAVARLHADPVFLAQMDGARREIARARAAGAAPKRDCQAEAQALKR